MATSHAMDRQGNKVSLKESFEGCRSWIEAQHLTERSACSLYIRLCFHNFTFNKCTFYNTRAAVMIILNCKRKALQSCLWCPCCKRAGFTLSAELASYPAVSWVDHSQPLVTSGHNTTKDKCKCKSFTTHCRPGNRKVNSCFTIKIQGWRNKGLCFKHFFHSGNFSDL